jgi:hypothetical protein
MKWTSDIPTEPGEYLELHIWKDGSHHWEVLIIFQDGTKIRQRCRLGDSSMFLDVYIKKVIKIRKGHPNLQILYTPLTLPEETFI